MKILIALLLGGTLCFAAEPQPDSDTRAIGDLIARRNVAYRNLDAKALASLFTPDYRLVDRLGDNYRSSGAAYNERMYAWGFKHVYRGRPGPVHRIINIELIAPTVALAQTAAQWDEIVLDNGQKVPPHGEIDTFIVVKREGEWKIKMQTIHNQANERIGDDFDFLTEPQGPVGAKVN